MKNKIQLSDHFDYKRLIRFTIPSILMMIFTSIYGVVDGFFVSNFVGKTPFAAVNFIMPFLMLQYAFSSLVITAEKPKLGLALTIITGVLNMTGDALFMAVFHWGIQGAALATAMGQIVGGLVPLIYFARKNSSRLRLCRPEWNGKALLRICTNGSSELMSNISMSIVGMLYNLQLMKYAGEDGVAAYGRTEESVKEKCCDHWNHLDRDVCRFRRAGRTAGRHVCRI